MAYEASARRPRRTCSRSCETVDAKASIAAVFAHAIASAASRMAYASGGACAGSVSTSRCHALPAATASGQRPP